MNARARTMAGFTLLEVIIAMIILSFLSLFTVQSIRNALRTKTKVQGEIDQNAEVRDALRVMERDINMAFNYRDISIELYNMAQQQRQKAATTPATTSPGQPPPVVPVPQADPNRFKLKQEKIYTQFVGEAEALTLTTTSNVRMMEDSPICSQAEVGYYLKPCRRRSDQQQSSNCLWRRVANYLHDDITQDYGESTVLLENVKELKFRYLGPGHDDDWVDSWITTERGDDTTKGKFPFAVEITLAVTEKSVEGKEKTLRLTTVAAIRNPNNPVDPNTGKDASGPPGTNGQPSATQPPGSI